MVECRSEGCTWGGNPDFEGFCSSCFNTHGSAEGKAKLRDSLSAKKNAELSFHSTINSILSLKSQTEQEASVKTWVTKVVPDPLFKDETVKDALRRAVRACHIPLINHLVGAGENADKRLLDEAFSFASWRALQHNERAFDFFVNHPLYDDPQGSTLRCIPYDAMENAIYSRHMSRDENKGLMTKLCELVKITPKMVASAEYSCKRPANVPTPEKLAVIDIIKAAQKAQAKARREELKRQREEEAAKERAAARESDADDTTEATAAASMTSSRRSTRRSHQHEGDSDDTLISLGDSVRTKKKARTSDGGAASSKGSKGDGEHDVTCKELRGLAVDECCIPRVSLKPSSTKLAVWTCGLVDPRHPRDHASCDKDRWHAVYRMSSDTLTTQLGSWRPEWNQYAEPWQGFAIPPSVLAAHGLTSEGDVSEIVGTILGLRDEPLGHEIKIKELKHARKTFFHNRWYYGFRGNQVDTKKLAKTKAATNIVKAATIKDSCVQVQFHVPDRAWYLNGILVIGQAKKWPGALFVMSYSDQEQDHNHHGSN